MYQNTTRKSCADRGLVLQSLSIPYEIFVDEQDCRVVVPNEFAEKAKYELWQYEQENQLQTARPATVTPVLQNALPGVFVYVLILGVVAILAGEAAFDRNWFVAGRVDGNLIRAGEWWRSITALTLHSGLKHFAGNAGFGVVFGLMAGRMLGSGITWLTVIVASSIANLVNTLLLDSSHRSIGASTAVFAVLGIVAGFVWRARLMKQDRWAYRVGPIVGGLALLAYTGTGDANTDVGAHVVGFVSGFIFGIVLTAIYRFVPQHNVQRVSAGVAITIVIAAWIIALTNV